MAQHDGHDRHAAGKDSLMSGYEKSKSWVSRTGHADLSMPSQLDSAVATQLHAIVKSWVEKGKSLGLLVQERRCLTINSVWKLLMLKDGI